MSKKELYIVGAGSVGGHVAWNLHQYSDQYDLVGFFDDDPEKIHSIQFGYKILGPVSDVFKLKDVSVVIGIAFPGIKKRVVQSLSKNQSLMYPNLVHRQAWISEDVRIGEGSIIYPGTSINYGSEIGRFVVMNMNCALGHHTEVGDYSSFAPCVTTGGHTHIGEAVDMGINSSTIQNIRIEAGCTVGGQSILIKNAEQGTTVAGVPSKELTRSD